MIETLQFVRGAVAKKDLIPVLTHFRIYDGRIQGGNGRLSIDAPCPELAGMDITVPAERFLKAVDACDGEPKLKITDGGKLSITRKKFRALLPLGDPNAFPLGTPDGKQVAHDGEFLTALRRLRQFVGEDASRPWACGILLKDGYAYATNNIIICRTPCHWGCLLEPINLPSFAVDELLRINQEPDSIRVTDTAIMFGYGDSWLKTQLFDLNWPEIDRFFDTKATAKVPAKLQDAITKILPFCPDPKFPAIRFGPDGVSTIDGDMMAEVSGIELPEACFRAEPLMMVLDVATHIDFYCFPNPSPWRGKNLEGMMVGVKL